MAKDTWPLDKQGKPVRRRRVPGESNGSIYERQDGTLEFCYRDSAGKLRWERVHGGITAARKARDDKRGAKARGERVAPNPRLQFGAAADRWLAEQVAELRPATRSIYTNAIENHLRPRWGKRRMDSIEVDDAAKLVRELRAEGLAEWTISGIVKVASRVFKFARRRCGWSGENPITLLENGERPKTGSTPERRIYSPDEFAQTISAAGEPWRTLFRLAGVTAGRESELLGLWWEDIGLDDINAATIRFSHQVDRAGQRVPLKTEESKATLPLPSSTARMLAEHKARSSNSGPKSFVFCTRSGRPLSQRNVLRELYRAQSKARKADGTPTFPELFEHDDKGHLRVDDNGRYVPTKLPRRELPALPDFHALRHSAAMEASDAEEARDLLRHKNSNVTRAIYRAHFSDQRRELLRAKMEARHAASLETAVETTDASSSASGDVIEIDKKRRNAG